MTSPGGWFFTTYRNNNCPVDTHFQDDYVGAAEEQNLVCGVQLVQHFRTSPIYLGGGRLTPSSISVVSDTPVFNQSTSNPSIMSYNSQAQLQTQVSSSSQTPDGTTITIPVNDALLKPGNPVIAIISTNNASAYNGFTQLVVFPPPPDNIPPPPDCGGNVRCIEPNAINTGDGWPV